jgi:hydroxymethylbilane synthase
VRLRLATRGSALAWTQSGHVADALRARGHEVELVRITTKGDVSDAPLASLGGAGVFVGAVRAAVLSGDCDLAVHSFKDLPTAAAPGLQLGAVPPREDPADALCARDGLPLAELPPGARVGTGSPRRAAQLLALRPDLTVVEIRGNVETRLRRAGADLDAVVLAAAGLRRLGLADRITQLFDVTTFLPAPAQGALAVECSAESPAELLEALSDLDDPATRLAALAERAVLARLEAGCAAPVAAHARLIEGRLSLTATVVALDGSRQVTEHAWSEPDTAAATALGDLIADRLLAAGAATLAELGAAKPRPLTGRRILLPERCPAGTAEALATAGAAVVQSTFTTQRPLPIAEFAGALAAGCNWLVVTSAGTVAVLHQQGFDLAAHLPTGTRVAAVGPATAAALRATGIAVERVADPGGGAALVAAFPAGPGLVLIPGAEQSSEEPAAGLQALGWTVRRVPVYRTVVAPQPPEVVREWPSFDAFVVTAGSVARAAVEAGGLPGPRVVAIGEAAARASRAAGLDVVAVADRPDAGGIAGAALEALA